MTRRQLEAIADREADRNGLSRSLVRAVISAESNWRVDARSPTGAEGPMQLMPGTARGLHVNPRDPVQNIVGGTKYLGHLLKTFGNPRLALAAYNAGPGAVHRFGGVPPYKETQDYVNKIMAQVVAGPSAGRPAARQLAPVNLGADSLTPTSRPVGVRIGPENPALRAALDASAPSQATQSILQRLGGTAASVASSASESIPLPATVTTSLGALPTAQPTTAPRGENFVPTAGGKLGKVVIAPGADRPGVRTGKQILNFVRRLAGMEGQPWTVGTGTNHSRLTVNGNVSAHWSGNATDIPATGAELIRKGQLALIAAGMPPAKARRQRGGLFNVGGWQIIFNTHEGGDHTNHLHVGVHHV